MGWDLEQTIVPAFFVALRIGSLLTFAPFFGSMAIPLRVKAGLTFALTVLLYPVYAAHTVPLGALNWFSAIAGELATGLLMGLALTFVFEGFELAGQILGFQFGFSLANLIDPTTQVDTPVLSIFHQLICLLIFLELGVHHWILRALAHSFEYLPAGAAGASLPSAAGLLHLAGEMLLIGVQIAAPALLVTMLTDLALGFLNKASPQLPVLFVGLSVKSLLGYAALIAAVAFWPGILQSHFTHTLRSAETLLHLAH